MVRACEYTNTLGARVRGTLSTVARSQRIDRCVREVFRPGACCACNMPPPFASVFAEMQARDATSGWETKTTAVDHISSATFCAL